MYAGIAQCCAGGTEVIRVGGGVVGFVGIAGVAQADLNVERVCSEGITHWLDQENVIASGSEIEGVEHLLHAIAGIRVCTPDKGSRVIVEH